MPGHLRARRRRLLPLLDWRTGDFRRSHALHAGGGGLIASTTAELGVEPSFGQYPLALDRHLRKPEGLCNLFDGQSSEVSQLYEGSLSRIELFECLQGVDDLNQVDGALAR